MRAVRSTLTLSALVLAVVIGIAAPVRAAGDAHDGPVAPIAALTETLLDTMRNARTLGFDGRRDKLTPVLRETFDFPFMARLAAGAHWSELDANDQSRFANLFGDMSIATFAARFDGYSGQTFEVGEPRDGPRGTRLVPTKLVHPDPDKAAVTISYLMRETDTGWHAVDVYLKGTYSELATKRSEYTSIIKRKGFDALVTRIRDKIAELAAGDRGGDGTTDGA
jgi:phospholipid transport system substrate-binding protein